MLVADLIFRGEVWSQILPPRSGSNPPYSLIGEC